MTMLTVYSNWQAKDEDGSGMDDQSLRDELMTLLVAVRNLNSCFCKSGTIAPTGSRH